MADKGFLDGILDHLQLVGAVLDSRDSNGRTDPRVASDIAWAVKGELSLLDVAYIHDLSSRMNSGISVSRTVSHSYTRTSAASPSIDERKSMNWDELSEGEKQRRIDKAQRTKARYSYWKALWKYIEIRDKLPPLELASVVWQEIKTTYERKNMWDSECREQFVKWLRKNHDIRMDSEDKMHKINRK